MAPAFNSPKTDPLMIRIFLAGLAGAVLMFLWTFIAHMVLPLGQAGMKELPEEVRSWKRCRRISRITLVFTGFLASVSGPIQAANNSARQ